MYTAAVYNLEDSQTLQGLTKEMQQYIGIARGRKKGYSIIEELTVDKTAKIIKFNDIEYEYTKKIAKVFEWDNNEIAIYEDLHKKHLLYKEAEQRYYNHYYSTGTKDVKLADEVAKCYKEKENDRAQFTEKMKKNNKNEFNKRYINVSYRNGI